MPEEQQQDEKARMKAMQKRMQEIQVARQKRALLQKLMTAEAYERFMNVRVANPELYEKLTDWMLAMAQSNRIQGQITEEQLKDILARLTQKPDTKIEFKHK